MFVTFEYKLINNSPFTCQYIIDNKNNKLLICFFLAQYYSKDTRLCVIFVDIKKDYLTFNDGWFSDTPSPLYYNSYNDVECIKSVVNSEYSKALVSLYTTSGELKSFSYDINYKKLDKIKFNQNFNNNRCNKKYLGLNVYYYHQNEQYINSCLDTNGNMFVEFYWNNLSIIDSQIIQKENENIYGYSILYSNCTDKYFIISEYESFNLLIGDNTELENIKKNFDISKCLFFEDSKEEEKGPSNSNNNPEDDSMSLGTIIIIILLICILLGGIIGFIFYIKNKRKLEKNINQKYYENMDGVTPLMPTNYKDKD